MIVSDYRVVLEYLPIAGGLEGNRFEACFFSEEKFNLMTSEHWSNLRLKVVAHGVTQERALELCSEVLLWKLVSGAHVMATINGGLDKVVLERELQRIATQRNASLPEMVIAENKYQQKNNS